jgi:hypothetical protein
VLSNVTHVGAHRPIARGTPGARELREPARRRGARCSETAKRLGDHKRVRVLMSQERKKSRGLVKRHSCDNFYECGIGTHEACDLAALTLSETTAHNL